MISGPFFVLAGWWVWLCLCVMAQMFVWWDIAKVLLALANVCISWEERECLGKHAW